MMKSVFFKIHLFSSLFILMGCATYNTQYSKTSQNWNQQVIKNNSEIKHTFYLVGDGGHAKSGKKLEHLSLLQQNLEEASTNSTVLFLGDNIYEKGLPQKEHPERALAEHRLDVQIDLLEGYKGRPIFIPGNHDYYADGLKGLKRQEKYIENALGKNAFLPENGCPLKKITVSEDLILLIIDSQWYLEDWNKHPTMNDDCSIKSRAAFFEAYESFIKKNTSKTLIVALHHPLFSNGSHGGHFSLKKHLFPVHKNIPLPLIGSFINLLRQTSGLSPQDNNNKMYREFRKRIIALSQKAKNLIVVSGHDHNLQYLFKNNIPQIISGSASKISAAKSGNGAEFTSGNLGYAKLDIYNNGRAIVSFYTERNQIQKLLYKKEIFVATEKESPKNNTNLFPKTVEASIYEKEAVEKNKLYKILWGAHYRNYYATKVSAPVALLDTLLGGLTPLRKGGGNQSTSVRLKDKNNKEYVMRALKKSATQYIQAVGFKDSYMEGQFDDTFSEDLLMDIFTAAHPYAPFTIGALADAIDLYHTNPKLYYVPKQKALKHFNEEFGDALYMIEERATDGHGDKKSFGYSNNLISTDDLLKNLRKSDDYTIDEPSYIRARLFDMLIGDWDRHEDQWRWAAFKKGKETTYKPVPRDRDQAFSKNDGLIMGFLTRAIPALKLMQVYDVEMRNVKWFNLEPYPLDMALMNQSTYEEWEKQVQFIQQNINDKVIEKAFLNVPKEVRDETVTTLKNKLKGRLQGLDQIAKSYYSQISKYGIIKGTDKDNWFDIQRLANGKTKVTSYTIKKGVKGRQTFEKIYSKNKTKEIWVYGLDDTDVFKVSGVTKNVIPLKLIGGQNNDEYLIESGKKVTIYDYKTKKNSFKTNKGKLKLTTDYETNVYHHKKVKYNQNQLLPAINSNRDDGLALGFSNLFTIYGFDRHPFTQQHTIHGGYYFATKSFDIAYHAEFANVFKRWNLLVETRFTSPFYSINHYGFGNESINHEEDFNDDYHRVRMSSQTLYPSLKWKGRMGSEFKIGGIFESIDIEHTAGRFITTIPDLIEGRQTYYGAQTTYSYENYDNPVFPTMGMNFTLHAGWRTNINNAKENNAFIRPSLSFNYKLIPNGALVLATKLKGHLILGKQVAFYHAASIGGTDGLRGYRDQRFTGHESFYQNTDLRFKLKEAKTALVPIQFGFYSSFDYGRVWLDGEQSHDWKTAYGGGLWLIGAKRIQVNLGLFDSKEQPQLRLGIGFNF